MDAAFDHFQTATCLIAAGDYAGAVAELDSAIETADDSMRPDLIALRASCAAKTD